MLAANVASFKVNFTSRKYVYDGTTTAGGGVCGTVTGTKDGIVALAGGGRERGHALRELQRDSGLELTVIDSVFIDLRVLYGAKQQQLPDPGRPAEMRNA